MQNRETFTIRPEAEPGVTPRLPTLDQWIEARLRRIIAESQNAYIKRIEYIAEQLDTHGHLSLIEGMLQRLNNLDRMLREQDEMIGRISQIAENALLRRTPRGPNQFDFESSTENLNAIDRELAKEASQANNVIAMKIHMFAGAPGLKCDECGQSAEHPIHQHDGKTQQPIPIELQGARRETDFGTVTGEPFPQPGETFSTGTARDGVLLGRGFESVRARVPHRHCGRDPMKCSECGEPLSHDLHDTPSPSEIDARQHE
jgi:hypothetical protein